ncbi:hypothetical protein CSC67_07570 [Pusillimonas caeni]|uniref:hypothetical protein n=1 Tax=Pusillimonas caeni TaxID=1348472 RepID=UPI0010753FF6|nr:hypothetical protein [Pusillimonas caeni]TFL14023.1 hypothetical protein CSC67_07570 [Pusillimonas caeni]
MKKYSLKDVIFVAAVASSLFGSSLACAAVSMPQEVGGHPGQVTQQYTIHTQLLKEGVSIHQAQMLALAGVASPYEKREHIHFSTAPLTTGFGFSITCSPDSSTDSDKIACTVNGDVAEATQFHEQSAKSLTEENGVTFNPPSVTSHYWSWPILVSNGEEFVLKANPYEFRMTVRKS